MVQRENAALVKTLEKIPRTRCALSDGICFTKDMRPGITMRNVANAGFPGLRHMGPKHFASCVGVNNQNIFITIYPLVENIFVLIINAWVVDSKPATKFCTQLLIVLCVKDH
jgi:hypothetical protein